MQGLRWKDTFTTSKSFHNMLAGSLELQQLMLRQWDLSSGASTF